MRIALLMGLTCALFALVGSGCSSGSTKVGPAPTNLVGSTTTTAPPPSTAAPTTPTTVAFIPQLTPDVAATALFDAWRRGDRHGALQVATQVAVDTLFARPAEADSDRGCQEPLNGQSTCAFGVFGGLVQVQTVTLAGGWVVQSVSINA